MKTQGQHEDQHSAQASQTLKKVHKIVQEVLRFQGRAQAQFCDLKRVQEVGASFIGPSPSFGCHLIQILEAKP